MLWIMIYHMGIDNPFLNPITRSGYLGVDIFLFLSAYGLYYGFQKDKKNINIFYKKRILRILPSYYFVLGITFLLKSYINQDFNIISLLQQISMLGFLFPSLQWDYFLWYIPGTLLLYLLFPIFFHKLKYIKDPKYFTSITIFIFILNYLLTEHIFYNNYEKFSILLLIPRILPFLLGLIWANIENQYINKILNHQKSIIILFICAFTIILIAKMELSYYHLRLYMLESTPFILALPGLFYIFISVYNRLNYKIQHIFTFMGTYSLELYLLHETLYSLAYKISQIIQIESFYVIIFMFFLSFIFAYYLKRLVPLIFMFSANKK